MAEVESDAASALGTVERGKFKRRAKLRYGVVGGRPDATRLIVIPPTVKAGTRGKLDRGLAAGLAPSGEHLLLVGADEHLFFGPGHRAHGIDALAQLISVHAEERSIALSEVVVVGRQLGGSVALWIATRLPVGRVIAGRAPIQVARLYRSLLTADPRVGAVAGGALMDAAVDVAEPNVAEPDVAAPSDAAASPAVAAQDKDARWLER
jgi:hypothetical protein